MNENEAYTIVIEWMIRESSNKEYIEKLNIILKGVKGKNSIEEHEHPKFQSQVIFGVSIFPFTKEEYIKIAELLKDDS